jgi:hypothetical protein
MRPWQHAVSSARGHRPGSLFLLCLPGRTPLLVCDGTNVSIHTIS